MEPNYWIEIFSQHYVIQAGGHTNKNMVLSTEISAAAPQLPLGSVIYKYAFNPHYWFVFDF